MSNDTIYRQAAIDAVCKAGCESGFCGIPCDDVKAIEQLPSAQPKPQWIPVSERLPEKAFGCLVTVWDTNPVTMDEFENLLPYFVGWDGEQWNDSEGEQCPFEVIAWMPLPEIYKEVGIDGEYASK